ncbi:hypothetical protein [Pelosinus sp. sgz500959]|uniref:hypothetical protein n=1 Tax=Pelosinus sp. sgz500959 TaxID=3242472 RepID=UPI003671722C
MNIEQDYVELIVTIENDELRENIEAMANDLQVTPERLLETIICAKYSNIG